MTGARAEMVRAGWGRREHSKGSGTAVPSSFLEIRLLRQHKRPTGIFSVLPSTIVRLWCSHVLLPWRAAFGPCVVGEISGEKMSTTITFDCLQLFPRHKKNTTGAIASAGSGSSFFHQGRVCFSPGKVFFHQVRFRGSAKFSPCRGAFFTTAARFSPCHWLVIIKRAMGVPVKWGCNSTAWRDRFFVGLHCSGLELGANVLCDGR